MEEICTRVKKINEQIICYFWMGLPTVSFKLTIRVLYIHRCTSVYHRLGELLANSDDSFVLKDCSMY
jgi:hypothetical protein